MNSICEIDMGMHIFALLKNGEVAQLVRAQDS
jgi:hypothetical protein